MPFLKQSSRSNYCAPYSTGMMLSLIGLTTKRSDALRLFNLKRSNPDFPGAGYSEIARVFASASKARQCRWKRQKRFRFASVSKLLRTQLRDNGYATLLSFGAIHKNGSWRCAHVAVALAATDEFIYLLDPLGKEPDNSVRGNVRLQLADGTEHIRVLGNSYTIDLDAEVFVLHWML